MMMYAVIEADGFFGDFATVCEVHAELKKAIGPISHDRRWQVIQGTGLEVGQKIHRKSIGEVYRQVHKSSK